jgi:hypothetical protein
MQAPVVIDLKLVSGVVVTRGNRDIHQVIDQMRCLGEVVVWDNSCEKNHLVYGRYKAIGRAKHDVIFTVDDDALVDVAKIVSEYEPGKLVCNMKPGHHDAYRGTGIALIGHGSVFDKSLVDFSAYLARFPQDEVFERECDRVFTWLNRDRFKWIALPICDLEHASQPGCMWMEPRHGDDLVEIKRRLAVL